MAGSGFGTNFRITTWGETHGAGVGVVVDGCPAGLPLEREDVQKYLDRRKPGQSKYTTQRKEGDQVGFFLVSSKEEQQGLRSPWLYITRIRGLKITAISKIFTVQDMQILHLT